MALKICSKCKFFSSELVWREGDKDIFHQYCMRPVVDLVSGETTRLHAYCKDERTDDIAGFKCGTVGKFYECLMEGE
jgi:hypothetical protein